MKTQATKLLATSVAAVFLTSPPTEAAVFNNGGDGVSWEDPTNWDTGVPAGSENIIILGNSQVEFDSGTWSYLSTNGLLTSGASGEYRGAGRLLMGESTSGATNGSHSLTFDQGGSNYVRFTSGASQIIGARSNKHSTLNIESGITNIEGNPVILGSQNNSSGTVNVNGGSLILGRASLNIGTADGIGTFNISGGTFANRSSVTVGSNGTFHVNGSGSTQIGIGSDGNIDGSWVQNSSGTLAASIDLGGVTKILVDDVGTGAAAVTFASGSILDLGFGVGVLPFEGTWTLMELENEAISDSGLTLAAGDAASGWSFDVDNSGSNGLLTVTYVPEPSVALLGGLSALGLLLRRRL